MIMTIQLLISTMHQTDYSLLEKMKIASDVVVINQCDRESTKTIEYNGHNVLWIDTTERGLSKSRNMAIRNATADICMLADDDMEYRCDYVDIVLSAFSRISSDIIGFQVCGIENSSCTQIEIRESFTCSLDNSLCCGSTKSYLCRL